MKTKRGNFESSAEEQQFRSEGAKRSPNSFMRGVSRAAPGSVAPAVPVRRDSAALAQLRALAATDPAGAIIALTEQLGDLLRFRRSAGDLFSVLPQFIQRMTALEPRLARLEKIEAEDSKAMRAARSFQASKK